jgi:hypothetical protein
VDVEDDVSLEGADDPDDVLLLLSGDDFFA